MRFENTPTGGDGSYEKPKPGRYIGILNGFAFVGTQGGGNFDPRPAVLLRWELHKRKGPSLDAQGYVHTITAKFGATVRGQNSRLRPVLEAHGLVIEEGGAIESATFLGRAAWLDLKPSDDGKYVNVAGAQPLDPDDDEAPEQQLESEHWEPDDGGPPPAWADFWVGRSTDLAHLARSKRPAAAPRPAPAPAPGAASDDDIPF